MISLTPRELFRLTALEPSGRTTWGEKVPSKASGVYVISVESIAAISFKAPFEEIERKNWCPDQEIVYIGRATVLGTRLGQFYKHVYGNSSPHRGGQAILLLDCIKTVTWTEIKDFGGAEDRLIKAFQSHAGRLPFGNRMRAARMKSASNRFVAEVSDIQMLGKHVKTVSNLTPEEEAENLKYDAYIAQQSGKISD